MKMRLNACLCTLFLCTVVTFVSAQERVLTLEETYRLADSNHRELRAAQLGIEAAALDVKSAKMALYPELSASLSLSFLGDGYCWDRNFSNGYKVDIPHFGNNFSFTVTQVLYAGGALKSQVELSHLAQQMSELQYRQKQQEIRFLLSAYYLDLYKMSNFLKVYDQNIALTQKLIDNIAARQEEGTALKNDRTRYELQLEDLQLARQKVVNQMAVINYEMVTALQLPTSTVIVPDTSFFNSTQEQQSTEQWQQNASQSALSLQLANKGVSIQKETERLTRAAMIPKIAVVAADHLDGPITIEVPVLNNNFNYWYVGVGVQYDFGSLYKSNNKYKSAQINTLRKEEEARNLQDEINRAIQAAYINLEDAHFELKIKQKTLELADQNYEVIDHRYTNDLALLTDMLDATNTKLAAELELVNARVNVIFCQIKLKFLCSNL